MKPKVSVIIPVYNAEKTLKQCLDSVLNQTYEDYEIIMVDNNSSDKTKEIIKEFQKTDKSNKIRYLLELKPGRGAARFKGEINAKGEIILMTDSDCIVPMDWIQEMIHTILTNKCKVVQGIKKPIIVNYWTTHIQKEEERQIATRTKGKKINWIDTANFAIKKSVLQAVGYTNPQLVNANDTELIVRLKMKNQDIFFKNFAVLHHHPDTALKVFRKMYDRGLWVHKVRAMYGPRNEFFEQMSVLSHLLYFKNLFLELLTLHKNFRYDLIAGVGWRIGSLKGLIKNERH